MINNPDSEELDKRAKLIAEKYDGILPYFEAFYLISIHYSSDRCLESFYHYQQLKNEDDVIPDYIISVVQEAIGHAAALSRYFWPSPGGTKSQKNLQELRLKRGKKLRESFNLDDTSPLFNRELRNAWEHFDERLDSYLAGMDSGMFFPNCQIGSHKLSDDPVDQYFKLLDIEAECLVLMGTKYFFAPIRYEVERIFAKNTEFFKNGARLKH